MSCCGFNPFKFVIGFAAHAFVGFVSLALFLEFIMTWKYVESGCDTIVRLLIYEIKCCAENGETVCTFVNHGLLGPKLQPIISTIWNAVQKILYPQTPSLLSKIF